MEPTDKKLINKHSKRHSPTVDKNGTPASTSTNSSIKAKAKKKSPHKFDNLGKTSNRYVSIAVAASAAAVIAVAVAIALRSQFNTNSDDPIEEVLAAAKQPLSSRQFRQFACSAAYTDELRKKWPKCLPVACGRFVDDSLASPEEVAVLLSLAKRGLQLGGGSGGASILDLHSGALSLGDKFVNVYTLTSNEGGGHGFVPTETERRLYASVVNRIRIAAASAFGVPDPSVLRLTRPTFFSRLTGAPARTQHDEYWHTHVDKETYGSFHFTSLLYLADYGVDFKGGRFVFVNGTGGESGRTVYVEPRAGRISAFTSGAENTHRVEQVTDGERFALTIAFSCDPASSINPEVLGPGAK